MTPVEGLWENPERPGESLLLVADTEGKAIAVFTTFNEFHRVVQYRSDKFTWGETAQVTEFQMVAHDIEPAGWKVTQRSPGTMKLQISPDGMRITLRPAQPSFEYPWTCRDGILLAINRLA